MSTLSTDISRQVEELLAEAQAIRVSNLKQSIALAGRALELSRTCGTELPVARSLSALAFFYMISGEYSTAVSMATEAAGIFEALNDEKGLADAKYTIASVCYKTDDLHSGLKHLTECITICRRQNDWQNLAKCYKVMGTIYEFFDDVENAVESYEAAVNAADRAGDINMKTNAFNPLSGLYLNNNQFAEAMNIIEQSITLKEQTGDIRGLAFALYGRGKIYTRTGQYQLAEADFEKAISIHTEMGEKLGLGMAYQKLGVLYIEKGRYKEAEAMLLEALALSETYNSRMIKTKASHLLYEVFKQRGDIAKALHYLEMHHAEQKANTQHQTRQIADNYKMIHRMEARALEDKMEQEKKEIMEKKNKAEYAAMVKQDFLSSMSHEIRTPLNAVITITNLLKERADTEDQQLLESLRFASGNLLLLINDILDFTKLETGKVQLEKRPVLLQNLLSSIKNTYESLAKEKGLLLHLDIDAEACGCYELDEMKLTQILGNLISNAIKFTDAGRVELSVRCAAKTPEGHRVRFEVKDTGQGIEADFLGEIFEAFSQPRSVTTRKQGGSGLGLAIVKKLANLYGSDIHIATTPGQGSAFAFELLLQPAVENPVTVPAAAPQLQDMQLLLAEDNKINVLVADKLLSRWGIAADVAANGLEAVEKSKEKKYGIILMDIHMPEMNGYEAAAIIRQADNLNCSTPLYALTADINANLHEEYRSCFNGFLLKPIEVNQLYKALTAAAGTEQ